MKTIHDIETLNQELQSGKKVLFFTADWCGDCRFIHPFMAEIESDFPDAQFIQINRDEMIDLCIELGIMGIPSFVVYNNGEEVGRLVNKKRKTKDEIEAFLKQF